MDHSVTRLKGADDQGSIAVEVAAFVPVAFLVIVLIAAFGRVSLAEGAAESAAQAAARAASLERDPGSARDAAQAQAESSLSQSGVTCVDVAIALDVSGLNVALGESATVQATVTCTAELADLMLPGLPGVKDLTATRTSVVDQHRARTQESP